MTYSDSYPQSGNAYTANVRANFTAIKNVLSQAALDGGWIRAQVVSSDPSAGNKGRLIFNETEEVLKIDDGFNWISISPKVRVKTGSYVGNAADDRDITDVGFTPDAVMLYQEYSGSSRYLIVKFNNAATDLSWIVGTSSLNPAVEADHIQALINDGFQIGGNNKVNMNGRTYRYIAIKEG